MKKYIVCIDTGYLKDIEADHVDLDEKNKIIKFTRLDSKGHIRTVAKFNLNNIKGFWLEKESEVNNE